MPQMSPMMWLMLFMTFSMIFILFNQMNFFSFKTKFLKKENPCLFKKKELAWKW
uniref:ATP synthase complex subunit 8 n=1 Tax=Apalacris nigrogeniculata TaxID=335052 RepID=A0A6G6A5D2_9ORTH|nr:ATP synthase F0 subunit 8 [Apalacris nigrogeniculata]YP_010703639.1 ATP synthase F0 subunit 8 [Xenocatantops humilis]QID03450.1 ATP synthase F0 subunit 8 [Apalacris nigrogeniculata]WCO86773.1 ATP synthase F0 subunit 8 [Xenocatantops humilis]